MPRRLAVLLANCKYANWFHERAAKATKEPFLRKEDDPLNGFWLYKCLKEAGEGPVQPLHSMRESEAHNMACISPHGLYRRPSNASIAVHFLKTVSAMRYVAAVLRWERIGEPRHTRARHHRSRATRTTTARRRSSRLTSGEHALLPASSCCQPASQPASLPACLPA